MEQNTSKFLKDIEGKITSRKRVENLYKFLRILLMVTIAVCGFITASISSNDAKGVWVFTTESLFPIGLISAVSAILNQALSPSEKSIFHKSVKKALQSIHYLVEYGSLETKTASRLMALALTEPDKALEEIHKIDLIK